MFFSYKTVFVLGAGSSHEYGYPLGHNLMKEIATNLQTPNSWLFKDLREHYGVADTDIHQFGSDLRQCGLDSIDRFLGMQKKDYVDLGRAAIGLTIANYERDERIWSVNNCWYRYLFEKLLQDDGGLAKNIGFVTFNYDRSLEHFLHTAVKKCLNMKSEQATELLSTVPIVHVHGKMGYLPWEAAQCSRPYGDLTNKIQLLNDTHGIKILHEPEETSNEFVEAKKLISVAERLVFLGFGYNMKNLTRLGPTYGGMNNRKLAMRFGSSIGLTKLERSQILNFFHEINLGDSTDYDHQNLNIDQGLCKHFLRHNVILN